MEFRSCCLCQREASRLNLKEKDLWGGLIFDEMTIQVNEFERSYVIIELDQLHSMIDTPSILITKEKSALCQKIISHCLYLLAEITLTA